MISPASNMQSVNLPQDTGPGMLSQGPEDSVWSRILAGAHGLLTGAGEGLENVLTSGQRARSVVLPEDVKANASPEDLAKLTPGGVDAMATFLKIATIPLMMNPLGLVAHFAVSKMGTAREANRAQLADLLIKRQQAITGTEAARASTHMAGQEELGRQVTTGELSRQAQTGLETQRLAGQHEHVIQQQADMEMRQTNLENLRFEHEKILQRSLLAGKDTSKESAQTTKYMTALDSIQKALANNMMLIQTPDTVKARQTLNKLSQVYSNLIASGLQKDPNLTTEEKVTMDKLMKNVIEAPHSAKDILLGTKGATSAPQTPEEEAADYMKGIQ